ncbi:ParB/RepB/Spo0J family partition protein [Streptomyces sp. NPDC056670]|uniref:ParB/RepB/Spo0J family partition protein n=1 Tax=Streptomyces sp. NPDC056670 TaxID=3345904 RepID=UPI00368E1215
MVRVSSLLPADSPRINGTDEEHARRLMGVGPALPPILVQRSSGRVVDGMHRLRAAVLRGDKDIAVQYFDGDDDESFVRAVRANVTHGLPLSSGERESAVARILSIHPDWSDRAVAQLAGVSPPTVGDIRRRSTDSAFQLDRRTGRDGRVRPVNSAEGRSRAVEIMRQRPEASLREVAREAGISVGTAHNVRVKLRAAQTGAVADRSAPEQQNGEAVKGAESAAPQGADESRTQVPRERRRILLSLRKDPSLRLTANGRYLLQWLGILAVDICCFDQLACSVPEHWVEGVARLARDSSASWQRLAEELERRMDRI